MLYLAFLYLDVDCDGQLSADDLSVHLPGVAEIEFGVCDILGYIGYSWLSYTWTRNMYTICYQARDKANDFRLISSSRCSF